MTDSENDETYEYKNRPEENEIFEDYRILPYFPGSFIAIPKIL